MSLHFVFMWLFFLNGLGYVIYTAFSGEWRYLVPNKHSFKEAWQVMLFDLKLSKIHPPERKFNGAQQIAYSSIILMGLGSVLTGIAIYKPVQFGWLVALFGGYEWARIIHFALTVGYCLFFLIHIAQVVKAGWNNFQAMVTGIEIKTIKPINEPKDEQ
jgi:thiosulfate reductase cytochrome b subunit